MTEPLLRSDEQLEREQRASVELADVAVLRDLRAREPRGVVAHARRDERVEVLLQSGVQTRDRLARGGAERKRDDRVAVRGHGQAPCVAPSPVANASAPRADSARRRGGRTRRARRPTLAATRP
jgi:hypothetical protein